MLQSTIIPSLIDVAQKSTMAQKHAAAVLYGKRTLAIERNYSLRTSNAVDDVHKEMQNIFPDRLQTCHGHIGIHQCSTKLHDRPRSRRIPTHGCSSRHVRHGCREKGMLMQPPRPKQEDASAPFYGY